MTLWARVRDGVLARVREGGRQVALALAEALRDRVAAGRVVVVVGSWRQVFGALGVPWPCAKTAIRALSLLAELAGGAVQRLGARGHSWVVSSAGALQLDLDLARDGKSESDPGGPRPAPQPAPPATRTPARSLALDRARSSLVAAELAARVEATGALERGEAVAVTITAPPGGDVIEIGRKFCEALAAAGGGAVLVPEASGHLHLHGVGAGTATAVDAALAACGAGHAAVNPIGDLRRWCGYMTKQWTGEELASGVLAGGGDGDGDEGEGGGAGSHAGSVGGGGGRSAGGAGAADAPAGDPCGAAGAVRGDTRLLEHHGGGGGARHVEQGRAGHPSCSGRLRAALGAAIRWVVGRVRR